MLLDEFRDDSVTAADPILIRIGRIAPDKPPPSSKRFWVGAALESVDQPPTGAKRSNFRSRDNPLALQSLAKGFERHPI
jgi:hypothetical protein